MAATVQSLITASSIHTAQCEKATQLLHARAGIILGDHKLGATQRTINHLASQYAGGDVKRFLCLLEQNALHQAWDEFVNAFTINHTAFFRESHHFEKLAQFFASKPDGCSIWCASTSTGEEAYSVAMVANEIYGDASGKCTIVATDIDTNALKVAAKGIYTIERSSGVSPERLKQHFFRGIEAQAGNVRVRPQVQSLVSFSAMNLNASFWPEMGPFDVVICRNTMIYFDRKNQERLIGRFAQVTCPGALLFVGHSENIAPLTQDFSLLGQTVYQRK